MRDRLRLKPLFADSGGQVADSAQHIAGGFPALVEMRARNQGSGCAIRAQSN